MPTITTSSIRIAIEPKFETGDEFLHSIGDVPMSRVVFDPWPGTATEQDLLNLANQGRRICELVNGTLVEKALGYLESILAIWLSHYILQYIETNPIGVVGGEQGPVRLLTDRIRIPDVSFISNKRLEGHTLSKEPVPAIGPDLAVEIISEGNTSAEMRQKMREYFQSDTLLVWLIYPQTRTVAVFEKLSDEPIRVLNQNDVLDGGIVLPGFTLELSKLFSKLPQ